MLDLKITIEGHKVVIEGLQKLGTKINAATRRGLTRIGGGIFGGAYYWLNGAGSKGRTSGVAIKENGKWKIKNQKWTPQSIPAGGYPVPKRSGHLLELLAWLKPGETNSIDGQTFFAFMNETVIYNSADYAETIFEGKGTSAAYGPRDALKDGLARFNQGNKINDIMEEEIHKEL